MVQGRFDKETAVIHAVRNEAIRACTMMVLEAVKRRRMVEGRMLPLTGVKCFTELS